ncbi:hypothetical protein EZV62_027473 [Acer yangbiense]|uniref:V-type proton ATPase subunit a n=1 Tax=Acer yangbiense TaxID=1000413 RepID=A0A5C7GUL5_9ROSI|nr:hypothetical protein EZV62_027473 [Acer yangbiense]
MLRKVRMSGSMQLRSKGCGKVDRKLRFFIEKITKAGLSPSTWSLGSVDLDLNSLEAREFFTSTQSRAAAQLRELEGRHNGEGSIDSPLLLEQEMITESSNHVKLGYVGGLVPREKSMAFERILFRATRGNVFLKQSVVEQPVTDPVCGEKVRA